MMMMMTITIMRSRTAKQVEGFHLQRLRAEPLGFSLDIARSALALLCRSSKLYDFHCNSQNLKIM